MQSEATTGLLTTIRKVKFRGLHRFAALTETIPIFALARVFLGGVVVGKTLDSEFSEDL